MPINFSSILKTISNLINLRLLHKTMTPLGVSLAFIMISILISVVKHFVFPSSAPTTSQQSSIELKKLYTITDKRPEKQSKSYSSFYQAYHQFHLSEAEEQKHRIQQNFMKHYNSLALKKTIINDEFTIICQENFLLIVSEGIDCSKSKQSSKQCEWVTQLNVYELPLLKEQTKQTLSIKGRIGLAAKDLEGQNLRGNLKCNKVPNTKKYFMIFPLSKTDASSEQETWTLNRLIVAKHQIDDDDEKKAQKISKTQKLKNTKQKRLQVRAYNNTYKEEQPSKKSLSQHSFNLQINSFPLHSPYHQPKTFSNHFQTITYTTSVTPWLIHYKIATTNRWRQIKILQPSIQSRIYQDLEYSSRIPPFDRKDRIEVKNLFVYETREDIYPINCDEKKENCEDKVRRKHKTYLTVVYQHGNNQFRVERFYVQLTFQIDKGEEGQVDSEIYQKHEEVSENTENHATFSEAKLVSYSLLVSEINPSRKIHSSCLINPKKQQIIERVFDKYYWIYENKLISSLKTYSLLCVFRFQVDQYLKVIQISDLIHSTEVNRYNDFAFFDWKSLNKILNYKENFQKETRIKNVHNLLKKKSNQSFVKINDNVDSDQNAQQKSVMVRRSQNPSDNIEEYLKIFSQEFAQTKKSEDKPQNQTSLKNGSVETKKKGRSRRKQLQKKDKSGKGGKSSKKKKKSKVQQQKKENMTLIKGFYVPNLQSSYDYSLIKKTVFPHRSQVKKYKFPLPFLLSFTQKMQIVDGNPLMPMILFSGVKQYLFTYNYKSQTTNEQNTSLPFKIVDYRYLTLGSNYKPTSKFFHASEGSPQYEIETVKAILRNIESKSVEKQKQKLTIQIKDETHPQVENVIKTMHESDEQILNQIKSIKSVPVEIKRRWSETSQQYELPQTYQRYLIVVWGWGVEVYLVDWDKNGFLRDNITQGEIEEQLSKKSSNLIEYFLPFIELFATFYCMFQALISSR